MSIIRVGMDTDKVEKDITKFYIGRLLGEIAELEKQLSNAQTMGDREQSIRDLEQKAKGIEDAVTKLERPDVPLAPYYILNNDLLNFAGALRNQAKTLKETK
jgi:hypothetical protein